MELKKTTYVLLSLVIITAVLSAINCKKAEDKNFVTSNEIEAHIRFLSDDLLEGRAVGSRGLEIAALYQENHFRSLDLEPFFKDSYLQEVVLKGCTPDTNASFEIFSELEPIDREFKLVDDFVVTSFREDNPEGVEGELLYCGYLIQAPERDWDDIKGADLKGKVLLVEINEPGNYPDGIFEGEDMTYYGRWVYKYEKASELGALGILIIHNTKGAAYGWDVVKNSNNKESFFLPEKQTNLFFQGWIHGQTAESIIEKAGFDHSQLKEKAETVDFKPVPLGINARVRQEVSFRTVRSNNVAALLKGTHKNKKDKYIILSAHYDHLGRDESLEGDQIYNGAVDNCSASACMLSLARYYSMRPEELKVNLIFVAVTAEEEGLLGSDYFARHLPLPTSDVLANLNFEMANVWGETEEVYAIGGKHSDLNEICAEAAEKIDVEYIPERDGELGYFFRSDQLSFARAGIPAVWMHEGITSRGENKDFILNKTREYRASKYHKVADEIEDDWDLNGTVQITRWANEIIKILQNREEIPQFKPTSSFRR
ncbi:MAG: M28 family peptidase [Candidatus Aminicenantes bacterium]|nr:M28 family peptidase [Candidatus Aminicenantes bacterium]